MAVAPTLVSEHGLSTPVRQGIPDAPNAPNPARTAAPKALTLAQQAQQLANQTVAAQVRAIQQQQQLATQRAQEQANQINAASQGAAQYLSGLGTPTYNNYKDAAQTLAGLSGGFSGSLQATAQTQADKVLADLAAVGGSPGQVTNTAPQLGNVLYGMRGLQPASTLLNAGTAAAARENAVPQSLIGYGSGLASGALAAGRTAADSLTPQILDAQGKLPTLTQQYLSQFQAAQTNAEKLALSRQLAQSLITSRKNAAINADNRNKVTDAGTWKAVPSATGTYVLVNSKSGATRDSGIPVKKTGAGKATSLQLRNIGGKVAYFNPKTGKLQVTDLPYGNQKPKTATSPDKVEWPNLTKNQVQHLKAGAANAYYGWKNSKDGKTYPPATYQQAITDLVKGGYSRAGATKAVNRFFTLPWQRRGGWTYGQPGPAGG